MADVLCEECGQAWGVNTPPALPLYPFGLIAHYCGGERKVRPPRTVEEIALVGSSARASRLGAFPCARVYLDLLVNVTLVCCESDCDVRPDQLRRLRCVWEALTEEERGVARVEIALFQFAVRVAEQHWSAPLTTHASMLLARPPSAAAANCPIGQLDNLNAVTPTEGGAARRSPDDPRGGV